LSKKWVIARIMLANKSGLLLGYRWLKKG
jgi:hypothetical protein